MQNQLFDNKAFYRLNLDGNMLFCLLRRRAPFKLTI